jgi:AraC-like DNA-binding protein
VAEYRLRRLINQRLGHRNFNAYVNGLRLDQARAVLADPAQRQLPVLTIALDAGFGSIGPFNRAFKAATRLTPTEYRRMRLDEKAASPGHPDGPAKSANHADQG